MKLKFTLSFLVCCASTFCFDTNSYETYIAAVTRTSAIIQNISQKITQDMMNQTTRAPERFSTAEYSKKMIEQIEQEIEQISDNKNAEQMSQEDKDLIAMLETYINQLEMYSPLT